MTQTLLLLHSAGLGGYLQPVSRDGNLIPVACNQQKARSTISIQISGPNHKTVWTDRRSHARKLFKVLTFHLCDTFDLPLPSFLLEKHNRFWCSRQVLGVRSQSMCQHQGGCVLREFASSFLKTQHPLYLQLRPSCTLPAVYMTIRKESEQRTVYSREKLRLTSHQRETVSTALSPSKTSPITTRRTNTGHLTLATSDIQHQRWNIMIYQQRHHVKAYMATLRSPVEVREGSL